MQFKTLIVDDEYPARDELRYLLGKYDWVEVIGEAATAKEALQLIEAVDYSILFLDVDMPGVNGLELTRQVRQLGDRAPCVIFVTAHEEFAVDAFAVDAIDYLLKPIEPRRLDKALAKALQHVSSRAVTSGFAPQPALRLPGSVSNQTGANGQPATQPTVGTVPSASRGQPLGLVPVEHKGKTILIDENNIVYVCACNNYTYVKVANDRYLTRFTLKELEERLNQDLFFRCHRSYLVNIKKAKEVVPLYNGTLVLVVDDLEKSEVPVSRSQARAMRHLLGL